MWFYECYFIKLFGFYQALLQTDTSPLPGPLRQTFLLKMHPCFYFILGNLQPRDSNPQGKIWGEQEEALVQTCCVCCSRWSGSEEGSSFLFCSEFLSFAPLLLAKLGLMLWMPHLFAYRLYSSCHEQVPVHKCMRKKLTSSHASSVSLMKIIIFLPFSLCIWSANDVLA